jgi:hypothetical protein
MLSPVNYDPTTNQPCQHMHCCTCSTPLQTSTGIPQSITTKLPTDIFTKYNATTTPPTNTHLGKIAQSLRQAAKGSEMMHQTFNPCCTIPSRLHRSTNQRQHGQKTSLMTTLTITACTNTGRNRAHTTSQEYPQGRRVASKYDHQVGCICLAFHSSLLLHHNSRLALLFSH